MTDDKLAHALLIGGCKSCFFIQTMKSENTGEITYTCKINWKNYKLCDDYIERDVIIE
jgi:hypothetical protein